MHIVLYQPEIAGNTGNVARTCAATGSRLHIVKPMGFEIDDKQLKRAGLDYWHLLDITYYDSLSDFLEKNKELTLDILKRGHTIGNHTFSHPNISSISDKSSCEKVRLYCEIFFK